MSSHANLYFSRLCWNKNDGTDIYLSFILNFKQYENANDANFVHFEKPLLTVVFARNENKNLLRLFAINHTYTHSVHH